MNSTKEIPIPFPRLLEEKFWSYVDRSGGPDSCWTWTSNKDNKGYGRIFRSSRPTRYWTAHRVSWVLANQKPLGDALVCHRCDNPSCCNPAHLWPCTNTENKADSVAKKRPPRLENHHNTKLKNEMVLDIRRRQECGESMRSLAREFGVNLRTIQRIVRRIGWVDLKDDGAVLNGEGER